LVPFVSFLKRQKPSPLTRNSNFFKILNRHFWRCRAQISTFFDLKSVQKRYKKVVWIDDHFLKRVKTGQKVPTAVSPGIDNPWYHLVLVNF